MGAVMNLLLIIFGVSVCVVWIISLVNWDGKCHMDCSKCFYECTEEEKSRLHTDTPIRNTVETNKPENRIK